MADTLQSATGNSAPWLNDLLGYVEKGAAIYNSVTNDPKTATPAPPPKPPANAPAPPATAAGLSTKTILLIAGAFVAVLALVFMSRK